MSVLQAFCVLQRVFRGVSLLLAAISVFSFGIDADAAPSLAPPAIYQPLDGNGVDAATGFYTPPSPTISIGPKGAGGLSFTPTFDNNSGHWRYNIGGAVARTPPFGTSLLLYSVTVMGRTYGFTRNADGTFIRSEGDPATLLYDGAGTYTLTEADGTVATFSKSLVSNSPFLANEGQLTSILRANGEKLSLTYGPVRRLQSVTSNYGYQIHVEYITDDPAGQWWVPSRITALNNAVAACDPAATTCAAASTCVATAACTQLTFTKTATEQTVTDNLGRVTRYFFTGGLLSGVRLPGSTSGQDIGVTWQFVADEFNVVRTLTTLSGTWTYDIGTITPPPLWTEYTSSNTITDPGGHSTSVVLTYRPQLAESRYVPRITAVTDQLGRTTTYAFSTRYQIAKVVYPEGNEVQLLYDGRGNLTSRTDKAKPGSGLPDIVVTATYQSPCANPKFCNKPSSIVDVRGFRTDFAYDATHGGVTSVTSPAPSGAAPIGTGTRPQKRTTYAQFSAWYRNPAGTIVQATPSIWLPTETSECQTTASCGNALDEVRTVQTYQAGSASVASNLLPLANTTRAGNSSVTATTTTTWTTLGDPLTVDGPRTDVTDVTTYRYDGMRQQLGEISPDPDGAGPLAMPAVRMTYTANGDITNVEKGSVTGTSDTAWSAFTTISNVQTLYDTARRKTRETSLIGGVAQQVTQYSYDGEGRLDCTAERMNAAAFANLPVSACTMGVEGAFRKDRVSKVIYDAADHILEEQSAVGTALAQTTIRRAYTPNGQVDWIEDANGNRSDYTYDGFDRLLKLAFPVTSVGAHAASATDFEQYGYDAAGNMTSKRLRSGETIGYTYDNLNRLSIKDIPGSTTIDVYSGYDLLSRKLFDRFGSTSGNGITYTYDALGRQLTEVRLLTGLSSKTLTSQYDAAGNRTRLTYPDNNFVAFTYDALNRLDQVRENGATSGVGLLADYAFDALSRPTSLAFGNGTATTLSYGASSQDWSFTQNLAGTSYDVTTAFTRNPAGQSATRDLSNSVYRYAVPTLSRAYVPDGLNRYNSVNGVAFGYDGRGNLTSDGVRTLGYDFENRLTSVTGPTSMTLAYDPGGRLAQTVAGGATVNFLYDGDRLVGEYDAAGTLLRRYVFGAGVDRPVVWYEGAALTDRRSLHADDLGSVIATNTGAGAVTVYTYGPYGEPDATNGWSGSRFRYTGQISLPEAKLYHYKARVYDPALGRFLQTDPVGYEDGPNWYAYVGNNSVNRIDPTGKQEEEVVVTARRPSPLSVFDMFVLGSQANQRFVGNLAFAIGVCSQSSYCSQMYPGAALNESAGEAATWDEIKGEASTGPDGQLEKEGGQDAADRDFDRLGPSDVRPTTEGGRAGKLPDGRWINTHKSSTDGRPTLEIRSSSGRRPEKIRYN